MDCFLQFCPEAQSEWQLLRAQVACFWGKIPLSSVHVSRLLTVFSPPPSAFAPWAGYFLRRRGDTRKYMDILLTLADMAVELWLVFLCAADVADEGRASALGSLFRCSGFGFHCVVCFTFALPLCTRVKSIELLQMFLQNPRAGAAFYSLLSIFSKML